MGKRVSISALIISLIFFGAAVLSAKAADYNQPNAYRIIDKDTDKLRQIAISFHHAILEFNDEAGYLIADLSEKEIEQLKMAGFTPKADLVWMKQYQEYQVQLQSLVQQHKSQKLAGIPGYSCYATVEETYATAQTLANNYPELAEWLDVGDSWMKAHGQGGYDLMVLKITDKNYSQFKPALFIHSAMHAREYTPAQLTLDFASQLLTDYQTNPDIRWLLQQREIHILFHMNPDGRKIAEQGFYQRKNTNQNHCPSGDVGVDLNRNFAFFWNSTADGSSGYACDSTFRGISPESEPETQAVSNYIRALFPDSRGPNDTDAAPANTPGMHLDIHSYSKLVLWPWGHKSTVSPNDAGFVELGNKLAWYNNYAPQQSVGLYPTDGTSDDVSYGELGIAAFTFELGTNFFQSCTEYTSRIKPDNLKSLLYAAKVSEAPYLLSSGPEVTQIGLNDSSTGLSIAQGVPITLTLATSALQTKIPSAGRSVSRAEYSLDHYFGETGVAPVELTNTTPSNSATPTFGGQLETTGLALGEHMIYFRAYNQNGQVGVTSAVLFTVGSNHSPLAEFSYQCVDLACDFNAEASQDSDGQIVEYRWNFSDGGEATGQTASYTFISEGQVEARLTIVDNEGAEASKLENFTVSQTTPLPEPTPDPEPEPEPEPSSSGGGSLWWSLGLILGLVGRRRYR